MNPESRPSKYLLDRYATGELSDEEAAAVRAQLDDRARAHLAAVAEVKDEVPAVDLDGLRARAASLPDAVASPENARVRPVNRWLGLAGLLVVAALAFVFLRPAPADHYATRGPELVLHLADGGVMDRYVAGTPVGEGDALGFEIREEGHHSVVVLSVDGSGAVSTFYPDQGTEPVALDGEGRTRLEGSVILDGAPGPEVFLAVFDRPVVDAEREVTAVFEQSGHAGLLEWAARTEAVSAVEITRR